MLNNAWLINSVDALLPQTQCGKCGHPGCRPYAVGIASGEPINKCPPGGAESIEAIATLLHLPVKALDESRGQGLPLIAFIREAECIGCTKCIQACPVDAILGAPKLMHTILQDECTGCDLCVAPCPVDCIEMRPLAADGTTLVGGFASDTATLEKRKQKRNVARERFERRNQRLTLLTKKLTVTSRSNSPASGSEAPNQSAIERIKSHRPSEESNSDHAQTTPNGNDVKKAKIHAAMCRAQLNKSIKAFYHPPTSENHLKLEELYAACSAAEQRLAAALEHLASSDSSDH